MAKRKKKNKQLKINLKYEVYGILIIVFSIIALIGEGSLTYINPVGKALRSICIFIAGHFHFIIPIIFIYIALYAMMNRSWPRKWSYRISGVLIAISAILISYHISLFEKPTPDLPISSKLIISNTYTYLSDAIVQSTSDTTERYIGGGMVGGLLYGLLYLFLGYSGTIIIVIAMFIIAFLFITKLSIVDTLGHMKARIKKMAKLLRSRRQLRSNRNKNRAKPVPASEVAPASISEDTAAWDHQLASEEDEQPAKKKPLLLQLLDKETSEESEEASMESPAVDHEDEEADLPLYHDFQQQRTSAVDSELDPDGVIIKEEDQETITATIGQDAFDKQKKSKPYQLPPFNLLAKSEEIKGGGSRDFKSNARKLEATLESFGVKTRVLEVVRGPAVTRYELQPDIGVKVSRIVSLTDDIALALAAKDIRMEAPIPGKAAIGIEVPNSDVSVVTMREVMESNAFLNSSSKLSVTLGRDISGQPIIGNLAKMPHLLVAGATGSGKSVCINGIIVSILYKAKPDEVKLLMIDPKKVELNVYNGIPHLLAPVVTDPRRASLALKKVVAEMERRYELFAKAGARNIEAYNEMIQHDETESTLPLIVVVVDELADLMMVAAKDVEDAICRLAQMARAAGIHLIIATQRPSVDVITGLIKANIPSRIAFAVSSQIDSRTILDTVGAEKLLGRGDMLFMPVGASKSIRVQGAFLTDSEVEAVVNYVKSQAETDYDEEMVPELESEEAGDQAEPPEDELFDQAVHIILEARQASVSLLQRRMRIGYTRAGRLIDSMEAQGIIGPYEGSKPRDVLLTLEQYMERQANA